MMRCTAWQSTIYVNDNPIAYVVETHVGWCACRVTRIVYLPHGRRAYDVPGLSRHTDDRYGTMISAAVTDESDGDAS
jgi:hypothetical protein